MPFRDITAADLPRLLELNDDALPAVSPLTLQDLEELVAMASLVVVAEVDGVVAGSAIGFAPGAPYASDNYRYFDNRFDDFHYLDRIVVDPAFHRRGIGSGLYDEVERRCGAPVLFCEVNLQPPNEGSMQFHQLRGFQQLDTQTTAGKTVALLGKDLTAAASPAGE